MYEKEVKEMITYMMDNYDTFADFIEKKTRGSVYSAIGGISDDHYEISYGATRFVVIDRINDLAYKFDYGKNSCSYCEIEYNNWQAIKDTEYANYFIPVEKATVWNMNVYVQPALDVDEEISEAYISEGIDFEDENTPYIDETDLIMKHLPEGVIDLLDQHQINDIHLGNIVIDENQIKIFDYAGYR